MPNKFAELVKPLSARSHSPAQLVAQNPTYESVQIPTEPDYTVESPIYDARIASSITPEGDDVIGE